MMTDPIADLLTRIRNGLRVGFDQIVLPSSKLKVGVCETLKREGYISNFSVADTKPQATLTVKLKYGPDGEDVIRSIQRVSKPGKRVYMGASDLPRPLSGLGIVVVSTNRGVKSDRECRLENVGGEVLCEVW